MSEIPDELVERYGALVANRNAGQYVPTRAITDFLQAALDDPDFVRLVIERHGKADGAVDTRNGQVLTVYAFPILEGE